MRWCVQGNWWGSNWAVASETADPQHRPIRLRHEPLSQSRSGTLAVTRILQQPLRRRDPPRDLLHQRHRIAECPLPAGDQSSGALPQRAIGVEVPVSGDTITGPHRPRQGTMDHAVEASAQRVRDHLRRPIPGRRNLLIETARNTVNAIDPSRDPHRPVFSLRRRRGCEFGQR
jgi:hypothetical protein